MRCKCSRHGYAEWVVHSGSHWKGGARCICSVSQVSHACYGITQSIAVSIVYMVDQGPGESVPTAWLWVVAMWSMNQMCLTALSDCKVIALLDVLSVGTDLYL